MPMKKKQSVFQMTATVNGLYIMMLNLQQCICHVTHHLCGSLCISNWALWHRVLEDMSRSRGRYWAKERMRGNRGTSRSVFRYTGCSLHRTINIAFDDTRDKRKSTHIVEVAVKRKVWSKTSNMLYNALIAICVRQSTLIATTRNTREIARVVDSVFAPQYMADVREFYSNLC